MDGNTGHGGIMVVRRIVRDAGVRIDGQPESKLCSLLKPRVYRGGTGGTAIGQVEGKVAK
jgi:hypothetical protein